MRDREKEIDSEKVSFEREVLQKYMVQKEEDLKAMRAEKQQWDQRDQEIHHNFVQVFICCMIVLFKIFLKIILQSINDFKRQLESDAKERAELWDQLLHHDEIELELTKQKESMEQMYIRKHQKVCYLSLKSAVYVNNKFVVDRGN